MLNTRELLKSVNALGEEFKLGKEVAVKYLVIGMKVIKSDQISSQFLCQSMLFQQGDLVFKQEQYVLAAARYLTAADPAFRSMEVSNFPKARRKAALCFIRASRYDEAEEVILRSTACHASDYYVLFLSAVQQGLQDQGRLPIINPKQSLTY